MRPGRAQGVLLAATVLLGLYLRFVRPEQVADLKPRPDALEYAEGARSLSRGDGYWLEIEGARYPPRYPPGLPLLLAAARPLVGGRAAAGIRVVLAAAILGILASWALAGDAGGPVAGLAAALLVTASPLHVQWSTALMSDVPAATVAALLGLWSLRVVARGAGGAELASLGFCAALSASLRLQSLAVVAPIAFLAGESLRRDDRVASRAGRVLAVLVGVVAGLVPLACYDATRFGSPLASGYALWQGAGFALRYLRQPPLGSAGLSNGRFYPEVLAGFGALYPWPIALLSLLGGTVAWRAGGRARRLVAFTFVFVAATLGLLLPFFWQADRFLLPLLPFVAACAAQALVPPAGRRARLTAAALALAGLLLVARRGDTPLDASSETRCLASIDAAVEPTAAVLLHTNPFLFRDYLRDRTEDGANAPRDRLWVPVGLDEHRKAIRKLGIVPVGPSTRGERWIVDVVGDPFDPGATTRGVRTLLASGRPVYYATANREFEVHFADDLRRLLDREFILTPVLDQELCRLLAVHAKDVGNTAPP
jgi:hypothetical protein